MVIINSDDFGYSPEVNYAIIEALNQNLISSTTTLVNFENGFLDAVNCHRTGKINANSIGIHLNLTEGIPLSESIKENTLFCENGQFHGKIRQNRNFFFNMATYQHVYEELESQLDRFVEYFGFKPTHIDSHHHVHTEWAIGKVVRQVAKKKEITRIRIARNTGPESSFLKKTYKKLYNFVLKNSGFSTVDGFVDNLNYKGFRLKSSVTYEIMVHAVSSNTSKDIIVDLDGESLRKKLERILEAEEWELKSYAAL